MPCMLRTAAMDVRLMSTMSQAAHVTSSSNETMRQYECLTTTHQTVIIKIKDVHALSNLLIDSVQFGFNSAQDA